MKRMHVIPFILLLLIAITIIDVARGQISIQSGPAITPVDMVETFLGDGVMFDNVTFQGADVARGVFTSGNSASLGIENGIFLTSGSGTGIPGPNTFPGISTANGTPGSATLNGITTGTTYDASVLEFDFVAEYDTLRIRYIFGSEDYNESVSSPYNDVCGIFISGPNPAGGNYTDKNMAIVPGTTNTIVSAYTVNNGFATFGTVPTGPCSHCAYFNDNTNGTELEYDGFTTVLVAWILVVPCQDYHLKLGVADVGDAIFDSGIFIEENSIKRPDITCEVITDPPGLEDHIVEGVVGVRLLFRLPEPSLSPYILYLNTAGNANPSGYPAGDFLEAIPASVYFEEGTDTVSIYLQPVFDGLIEGPETLFLVYEDPVGCTFMTDTVELIIEDYFEMTLQTSPNTIICEGMEVNLWASVENGYPPYSYLWEPGGLTTDSITVSPDTTTTYYVQVSDAVNTVIDSVQVFVFPNNYDVLAYSFEKANNPQLPWDVVGEILEDSISLFVPAGTDVTNLIASFTLEEGAIVAVNNTWQISGVTPNDFTGPVIYHVLGPGGCPKDWTVVVDLATGAEENDLNSVVIAPNPAAGNLVIEHAGGSEFYLFNGMGDRVLKSEVKESHCNLDVHHLPNGIYFIRIKRGHKETTRKLIIAR